MSPEEKVEKWLNEIWANKPFGAHAGVTVPKEAIANLLAKLAIAEEALNFYADRKNWALSGSLGSIREFAQIKSWGDGLSDRGDFKELNTGKLDPEEFLTIRCCGEKAREALKKIRGEL